MDIKSITQDILISEGGFWNDPIGGPTNFGITQNTLTKIRPLYSGLPETVEELTIDEAAYIIEHEYVRRQRVAELPAPLDVLMGHMVVMSWDDGVRILQEMLGFEQKAVDGIIGPMTLEAVNNVNPLTVFGLSWRVTHRFITSRDNGYGSSYATRFDEVLDRVLS
jgi:lysozyme family protein